MIEELKSRVSIYDILGKYGIATNHSGMIVCPFHSDKNASCKIYNNNTFHCFGCGADGDIFSFVQKMENCDFIKSVEIVSDGGFKKYIQPIQNIKQQKCAINPQKIRNYILKCQQNLSKTDYFYKRHLTTETQIRFGLGYDTKYNSVVIPYNRNLTYYQSRSVETKKFYKPNAAVAGSEPLFNVNALNLADFVFVVESPICAMSIAQCGYNAVAVCGTQGWKKLSISKMHPQCVLVLAFDNDLEGKKAQSNLKNALPNKCVEYNIADECKDPNELLMKDSDRLQKNLDNVIKLLNKNILHL